MLYFRLPKDIRSLTWLSIRQTFAVALCACAVALIALALDAKRYNPRYYNLAIPIAFSFLGFYQFSVDHIKNRYRFLADRSVSPTRFYWCKTIPALVLIVSTVLVGDYTHPFSRCDEKYFISLSIASLAIGQLMSICVQSWIIGLAGNYLLLYGFVRFLFDDGKHLLEEWYYHYFWIGSLGFTAVVMASTLTLLPRWLRDDQPRIAMWLLVILPISTFVGITSFVSVAIYSIPYGQRHIEPTSIPKEEEYLNSYKIEYYMLDQSRYKTKFRGYFEETYNAEKRLELLEIFETSTPSPDRDIQSEATRDIVRHRQRAWTLLTMLEIYIDEENWEMANRALALLIPTCMESRNEHLFSIDFNLSRILSTADDAKLEHLQIDGNWLNSEYPVESYARRLEMLLGSSDRFVSSKFNRRPKILELANWIERHRQDRLIRYYEMTAESVLKQISQAERLEQLDRIRRDVLDSFHHIDSPFQEFRDYIEYRRFRIGLKDRLRQPEPNG